MKTKLLASIALLGLSMGAAQAVSLTPDLTFSGDYAFDGDVDLFAFNANSTGEISIWVDTLTDGLDANGAIFRKNGVTGAYDFYAKVFNATQPGGSTNTTGFNDYNVAIKNGYDINDPFNMPGVSDPGITLNMEVGSYLYAATGFDWDPAAYFNGGGTFGDGYLNANTEVYFFFDPQREWSTWDYDLTNTTFDNDNGIAHNYEVYIAGDVSAVSNVPVPAAAWLFMSALAGLGSVSRRKIEGIA